MSKRRANKEGSIDQLPSGTWRGQISIQGKRLSYTAPTQREVIEWIRKTRDQVDQGLNVKSMRVTFGDFSGEWLPAIKTSLKPGTWNQYNQLLRDHLQPIGHFKLKDLRPDHIQSVYNDMLRKGKGVYVVLKLHTALHNCLEHARAMGAIITNPSDKVILPKPPDEEMKFLDESEVARLMLAARNTRYEALLNLAVHTGMRQMEMLGLKWSDVDWTKRRISVRRQLKRKRKGEDWDFGPLKTKRAKRTLSIGARTMDLFRAHLERQQHERLQAGERWQEFDLIFPSSVGTPMFPRNLLDDFKLILERAGLENIRFHDLRHTAAAIMLAHNPRGIMAVSRRLGHARPSITLDLYGHLLPDADAETAEMMDDLIMPVEIDLSEYADLEDS